MKKFTVSFSLLLYLLLSFSLSAQQLDLSKFNGLKFR